MTSDADAQRLLSPAAGARSVTETKRYRRLAVGCKTWLGIGFSVATISTTARSEQHRIDLFVNDDERDGDKWFTLKLTLREPPRCP